MRRWTALMSCLRAKQDSKGGGEAQITKFHLSSHSLPFSSTANYSHSNTDLVRQSKVNKARPPLFESFLHSRKNRPTECKPILIGEDGVIDSNLFTISGGQEDVSVENILQAYCL